MLVAVVQESVRKAKICYVLQLPLLFEEDGQTQSLYCKPPGR